MATNVLEENVERLFKSFTFKCLQVIVQSRIAGQTFRTPRTASSSDYFCISIHDNQVVDEHIRRSLDKVRSFPVKDQNVCVEVSLITNDGDHMFLESWDIGFNINSLDMSASKMQHIFTRMGVTLKSLLCATRAMPAYRLAKNQGEKDGGYRLNYRFYLGKPQTHLLGEGFRTVRAGTVPTAHGQLSINVSFRTKLLLSPEMSASAMTAVELTDNYFVKDSRAASAPPTVSEPRPCSPPPRSHSSQSESPYHFAVSPSSLDREETEIRSGATGDCVPWRIHSIFNMDELPEPIVGAFAVQKPGHKHKELEMPFEGLMKKSFMARQEQRASSRAANSDDWEGESEVDMNLVEPKTKVKVHVTNDDDKENSSLSMMDFLKDPHSVEEEFILVDKPPFAAEDDPRDVKSFLSVMFRPARLYELPDCKISVTDYLNDVEEFVSKLEKDMPELDEFCQSITSVCSQEDEESGSQFC